MCPTWDTKGFDQNRPGTRNSDMSITAIDVRFFFLTYLVICLWQGDLALAPFYPTPVGFQSPHQELILAWGSDLAHQLSCSCKEWGIGASLSKNI